MSKKYSYLIEILIGISLILFINMMWFGSDMGFIGALVSPYWIIVIFIAIRYGSFEGFVAGLASSAALLISVTYNISIEKDVEFSRIPIQQAELSALFVLIGFFVGGERGRVNNAIRKWREKHNRLRDEFEAIAMEHVALKNVNTELQGRILGQSETVNTIYEAAKELVTLKVDQLYPSIVRLTKRMVGAEKCSLYLWEEEKYVLKAQMGWGLEEAEKRKILNDQSDIVRKSIADNSVTTVVDVFKSGDLQWAEGRDPCMVSPLYFGEQVDVPSGFIVIDEISFLKFNPDNIRFLHSLSDWISKSLDNARESVSVRRKDVYDEELKVFNYTYAMRKLQEELLNVQVTGRSSSAVLVRIKDFDQVPEAQKNSARRELILTLGKALRSSDTIARYFEEDAFVIVLPGSDLQGAGIVKNRIREQLDKAGLKPYHDKEKSLDAILESRVIEATLKDVSALFLG